MKRAYYEKLEQKPDGFICNLSEVVEQLGFNEQGLIPVITQDAISKNILMFAWMNKESLEQTLSTLQVTYWSRSRKQLWMKGEVSGHTQTLVSIAFDCDGDAVLCQVDQSGPACHTGRPDCFYLTVDLDQQQVIVMRDSCQ